MESKGSNKIKEAFFALLNETKYSDISINDIAQKAQMTRRTFYLHYENKLQLFEEVMGDFIEFNLNPFLYEQEDLRFALKIQNVIHTIRTHYDVANCLFNEDCPKVAKNMIAAILNNQIHQHEAKGFFLYHFDNLYTQYYFVDAVSNNLLGVIHFTLSTMNLTLEEQMSEICKACDMISYFYKTNLHEEE